MGIENLWVILDDKECVQNIALPRLRNLIRTGVDKCRIAVDARLLFHKYFSSCWRIAMERGRFSYDKVYAEAIRMIGDFRRTFMNENIEQVWCLDGDRSSDKLATSRRIVSSEPQFLEIVKTHKFCSERSTDDVEINAIRPYSFLRDSWHLLERSSQEIETTSSVLDQIESLKKMLSKYPIIPHDFVDIMQRELTEQGFEFLRVPEISEGEKLCVYAVQTGYCQAVFTRDGDVIPMGVRCVIKEMKDGICKVYSYSQILYKLQLTHQQFLSLCILLGTDFNDGVEGMGRVKCLAEVTKKDFNIYDFDISRCGCLRVNACINALTLNNTEFNLVYKAIENL